MSKKDFNYEHRFFISDDKQSLSSASTYVTVESGKEDDPFMAFEAGLDISDGHGRISFYSYCTAYDKGRAREKSRDFLRDLLALRDGIDSLIDKVGEGLDKYEKLEKKNSKE
jgi:hypothetical protein